MRVRVVWFGRPAASPYEDQVRTYRRRVEQRWPAEDLPLRSVSGGRDQDPRRVLRAEAEAVRRVVPERWRLVTLDERGRSVSSEGLARYLEQAEGSGDPGLVLVVGSDLGLDLKLREEAALSLSLSPMTLPHLLARLLLWEQLFRASQILGGGGYHRRSVQ
jgi:23S rRNA (pseudouridine1915-N3)-methyltransferase